MLFRHKIIDDYYAEESVYPYPPKDIQLIILRYSSKLNMQTCKNIRLVRKCFSTDKIITEQFKKWKNDFEKPLIHFKKIKRAYDEFCNMGYVDTIKWYWDTQLFRRNAYGRSFRESISFKFDYLGRNGGFLSGYCANMNKIGLIEVSEKYGEIAVLFKPKSDAYSDVLFFIYIDDESNINYTYNYILSGWIFNDEKTYDTLKYIEKNDNNAKKDNIILDFNDFELKVINTYCENEEKNRKDIPSMKKYKGLVTYFANLDIQYIRVNQYSPYLDLHLNENYPLPKVAKDDFTNAYWY